MAIKASFVVKDNSVSIVNKSLDFTLKEKMDTTVVLNNETYEVDISNVGNIVLLAFEGSGDFTVTLVQGVNTMVLTVTDYFAMTLDPTSAATLDSIVVGEPNSVDVTIHCIAYGQATV